MVPRRQSCSLSQSLVILSENSGKHDSGKHGHSRPYEGSVKVLHSLHRLFLNICPRSEPESMKDQVHLFGLSSSKAFGTKCEG